MNPPDACSAPSVAFGAPGMPPRWTRGAKEAIGTAYSAASRLWFTLAQGTLTEIYYPTVDRPQVRDLQYLFTDGASFFAGERRDCDARTEALSPHALGFRVATEDRQGRFRCEKEIVADPHLSCLLLHTRLEVGAELSRSLRMFVLCAPHLDGIGWHNNAEVVEIAGRRILLAHHNQIWMAIGATVPLAYASAGYVGSSDGWTDLAAHLRPTLEFASAPDGNVALVAELDWRQLGDAMSASGRPLPGIEARPPSDQRERPRQKVASHFNNSRHGASRVHEFTLGLAFGDSQHAAVNTLMQSLGQPFALARNRFLEQWDRTREHRLPLEAHAQDAGALYHRSISLLLAHEDKTYPGALIASLAIPWGEAKGDEDLGGYHLVWTRDLVNSAGGLLASGDPHTARRALIYLTATQHADGGFAQNFWINGTPYWQGIQLDEVAFPILLAWRLRQQGGLRDLYPYPMVARAAAYLMRHGPSTPQERWEEAGGYSPSSLAAQIAGLVCAADFAHAEGDDALAHLALDYADFLESHLEAWTVTTQGTLLPGVSRHYIRINPAPRLGVGANEDPNTATLHINNRGPGQASEFPARDIVDAGFLELVRYGIRPPGDPLIEDSLRVVDATLKVATPYGPCWRRYNHDGYGQRADGSAFEGWGRGGAWPLLTGERAHYELAAGRDVAPFVRAMERLANHLHLLPEQVWDLPDLPAAFLSFGRPSGSAMPLMWAHAEYLRLLRSIADGAIFDHIPAVAARYLHGHRRKKPLEIWKLHRQVPTLPASATLRIQLLEPFFLHFSRDGWATIEELRSTPTAYGFEYLDLQPARGQTAPFQFTFRYANDGRWQGQDFQVAIGH